MNVGNMTELVSIVLPVYNGENNLEESIKSILNQTYEKIELIIVNDCSTDSSEEIILKNKNNDDRIVYIKNNTNLKLPRSLNIGFEMAQGKYYTWTSDDNKYHVDAVETMVSFLEEHNDVGLVYCDFNVIDESGSFCYNVSVREAKELIFRNVIGACFLYRSEIASKIGGYDADLFLVEDYEYWLRIFLESTVCPLHSCLYDYRVHEKSLTATRKKEIQIALEKLQWKYLKKYERVNIEKNELYDYFDYIITTKNKRIERIWKRACFSLKHIGYLRKYFIALLRKLRKE